MRGKAHEGFAAHGGVLTMDDVGQPGPEPAGKRQLRVTARLFLAAAFAVGGISLPTSAAAAPPPTPPSRGAVPLSTGHMPLPSTGIPGQPGPGAIPAPPVSSDPVVQQISQQQTALAQLGEQFNAAGEELVPLTTRRAEAAVALEAATLKRAEKQLAADEWARSTYIEAAGHPSGLPTSSTLPGRGSLPGTRIVDTPLTELAAAQAAYDKALADNAAATAAEVAKQTEVEALRQQLDAQNAALTALRTQHSSAVIADQQRRDSQNNAISAQYLRDAAGYANPKALKALQFALAQLGKPYKWGAEGPDFYDCSGLVQTAYKQAGVSLPRTARPQYRATRVQSISSLLPGDLLFFATSRSDWNTIHHVAIYLGKGKMLHAPTTGELVKISPIWWEEFFAA